MSPSDRNNAELLRACVDTGAVEEWAEFVSRFQPLIAGVLARVVASYRGRAEPALIDDLVQETYLRLCRNNCRALREFRPEHEASFYGYLKNTACSVARDYFRAQGAVRRGPEPTTLDEMAERQAVQSQPSVEATLLHSEVWRQLEAIVESPRDLTVFRLHHLQGFTAKEIAAMPVLQLTEKGVESCLHRLFVRLQKVIHFASPHAGSSKDFPLGSVG